VATTELQPVIVENVAIRAPIAAVFAALTEPDQLVQWWGTDDTYRVSTMHADLRPGGAWTTGGIGRDGSSFTVDGVYRVVEPPRLLEFTWRHDWVEGSDATETLVRYELAERDGITHLTVTHSGFTTAVDRDNHAKGWPVVLGWMSAFVTQRVAAGTLD
jgi:uncharacterized protein YndB with AHSA1/START domain